MKKLTPTDEICIQEYINNGANQSEAYRSAFAKRCARWKPETIHVKASKFFATDKVRTRLDEISQKVQEDTGIDAEYVLRQAVKLHERCMQEVEPLTDRKGDQIHDTEGHPLYRFNASGAAKALELVGKHRLVQAFKENHVVETDGFEALMELASNTPLGSVQGRLANRGLLARLQGKEEGDS